MVAAGHLVLVSMAENVVETTDIAVSVAGTAAAMTAMEVAVMIGMVVAARTGTVVARTDTVVVERTGLEGAASVTSHLVVEVIGKVLPETGWFAPTLFEEKLEGSVLDVSSTTTTAPAGSASSSFCTGSASAYSNTYC